MEIRGDTGAWVVDGHVVNPSADQITDTRPGAEVAALGADLYEIYEARTTDSGDMFPGLGETRVFNGVEFQSLLHVNVFTPDEYPDGWRQA